MQSRRTSARPRASSPHASNRNQGIHLSWLKALQASCLRRFVTALPSMFSCPRIRLFQRGWLSRRAPCRGLNSPTHWAPWLCGVRAMGKCLVRIRCQHWRVTLRLQRPLKSPSRIQGSRPTDLQRSKSWTPLRYPPGQPNVSLRASFMARISRRHFSLCRPAMRVWASLRCHRCWP